MTSETRTELLAALPAGDTWSWPEWVPVPVREQIESFHRHHRGPKSWRECAVGDYNRHPRFGQRVEVTEEYTHPRSVAKYVGRWVPAWNNMGRIVLDDGSWQVASTCRWQPADFINDRDPGDES